MSSGSRPRLVWTISLLALYGLAFATMYVLWARFQPAYFWSATGVVVLALLLVWTLGRKRKTEDVTGAPVVEQIAAQTTVTTGGGVQQWQSTTAKPDYAAPLPALVVAKQQPQEVPAPAYALKGFTLYERTLKGKAQRTFAKAPPVGGWRAIALPDGFEAVWDRKQKKPVLAPTALAAPAVQEEDDALALPNPTRVVTTNEARMCAAMTSPGIFCTKPARAGEATCGVHAKWTGASELVVKPGGKGAVKGLRIKAPEFEARVARPVPPRKLKPLNFTPAKLDVRVAKPKEGKAIRFGTGTLDARVAKPKPGKPIKFGSGSLDVHVAKPKLGKPIKFGTGALDVRTSKPKAGKALRLGRAAEPEVRTARSGPSKKASKLPRVQAVVREAQRASPKPLRVVGADDFDVRIARAKNGKANAVRRVVTTLEVRKPQSKGIASLRGLRVVGADDMVVQQDTKKTSLLGLGAEKKARRA